MTAHRINPVDLLKTYDVQELERRASEQIQSWGSNFSIPVDIEHLLETTPNIDLDIYPCLRDLYGLEGMVGLNDRGILTVYIDEFLSDNEAYLRRYRMTVAEEFAHVLLHREAVESVRTPEGFLYLHKSPNWYKCERNAKRLAAMLLMPSKDVLKHGRSLYSAIITNLPSEQRYTNRMGESIKNMIRGKLADKYCVSPHTMGIRLGEWPINLYEKIDEAVKNHFDFLE